MTKVFSVDFTVEVEIDDDKIDEILKDFRSSISSNATVYDIFSQIAWNEVKFGGFCEGIGEEGVDFNAKVLGCDTEEID